MMVWRRILYKVLTKPGTDEDHPYIDTPLEVNELNILVWRSEYLGKKSNRVDDSLAPCLPKSSAAVVLTCYDKPVLVFR